MSTHKEIAMSILSTLDKSIVNIDSLINQAMLHSMQHSIEHSEYSLVERTLNTAKVLKPALLPNLLDWACDHSKFDFHVKDGKFVSGKAVKDKTPSEIDVKLFPTEYLSQSRALEKEIKKQNAKDKKAAKQLEAEQSDRQRIESVKIAAENTAIKNLSVNDIIGLLAARLNEMSLDNLLKVTEITDMEIRVREFEHQNKQQAA